MGVCFQLSKKSNPEFIPEIFAHVDDAMCEYFGATPDPVRYFKGWFDIEGFALAMGKDFDWLRKNYGKDRLPIIDFLDHYYVCDNWRE